MAPSPKRHFQWDGGSSEHGIISLMEKLEIHSTKVVETEKVIKKLEYNDSNNLELAYL
jgi:hypothetical protein